LEHGEDGRLAVWPCLGLELAEDGALADRRRLRFDLGEDGALAERGLFRCRELAGLGGAGGRDQRQHGDSHR
jgi:hypothetical protein